MTLNATRVGIWGGSGSGKSTRAKELTARCRRIVAFDPMEEYAAQGFRQFSTLPSLGHHLAGSFGNFRACYVPPAGQEVEALHSLSNMLRDMQNGYKAGLHRAQLHFLVEEMNTCFPTAMKAEFSGFANLCSRGRHFGINLYGISQRPNEVHTRFRGNLEHVYAFRLIDHVDLKSLAGALGSSYADKIRLLNPHEYYYRGLDGRIVKGVNLLGSPANDN
ncbi:hypothetical protein [Kordiimonas sp.]|uniref:hypothetical protein n=1 Tax=Kordiimonas sp. TaxID=1970157 RepID=UPI003B51B240